MYLTYEQLCNEVRTLEIQLRTAKVALKDIESNWDHEHPNKGPVHEECEHDPAQCRSCIAKEALRIIAKEGR